MDNPNGQSGTWAMMLVVAGFPTLTTGLPRHDVRVRCRSRDRVPDENTLQETLVEPAGVMHACEDFKGTRGTPTIFGDLGPCPSCVVETGDGLTWVVMEPDPSP